MIKHLSISNYSLIDTLSFEPHDKLNTITGETGAGKSILLGALGLLLGKRADTKVLLNEEKKCVVEGEFEIAPLNLQLFFKESDLDYESPCTIRREINTSGKSRAFVNDTPVTLDVLKELGVLLVDIHSQHETLLLQKRDFQLNIIDSFAENQPLLNKYQEAYNAFAEKKSELSRLEKDADASKQELDYNQFLLKEFSEIDLENIHQGEIEASLKKLENAEEIKSKLHESSILLSEGEINASTQLYEAINGLSKISSFSPEIENLFKRLQSAQVEIDDIYQEINAEKEAIEVDPVKAETLRDQLNLLFKLQQKHQVKTSEELLQIKEELNNKVETVVNLDQTLHSLRKESEEALETVRKLAHQLSESRKNIISKLEQNILNFLHQLGMPEAVIEIAMNEKEPDISGTDQVEILFSANKGVVPMPIKKVASGGEFSRLMFSLKFVLANSQALPTLIFDEIDTGISGEVALSMGQMMKKMAENHQVITITHLPQMAGKGNRHFYVFKDSSGSRTTSQIKALTQEERITELAKMIGGDDPSENAFKSAEELIS